MRILLLTSDFAGRGANYIRAFNLGRALAGTGHEVTLVAASPARARSARRVRRDGVTIITGVAVESARLRRAGWGPVESIGRMLVLRKESFEIVHAFGHRPSAWLPIVGLRRSRRGVVAADWADLFGRGGIADERKWLGRVTIGALDTWLEAGMRLRASAITVITSHLEALARQQGFPEEQILRLTAGASVDSIRPLPKAEMRTRLGLEPDRPVVVNAGLSAWDRPAVLQLFREVARRHQTTRFLLVGETSGEAIGKAEAEGWGDRLIAHPHVPHDSLGDLLACADVTVIPFPERGMNRGRFPNQAGDSMAAARPIVTNPTGDLGKFVELHRVGLLAGEDSAEMAEAVVHLLRNPDLAMTLGENGRRAAEQHLAWPHLAGKLIAFYERLRSSSS